MTPELNFSSRDQLARGPPAGLLGRLGIRWAGERGGPDIVHARPLSAKTWPQEALGSTAAVQNSSCTNSRNKVLLLVTDLQGRLYRNLKNIEILIVDPHVDEI